MSVSQSTDTWRGVAMARLRRANRTTWSIALVLLALAVWGLTDVRTRGFVVPESPWLHKTDVTVYTGAGAAMFDGRDPYAVVSPRGWHYLYPPLFAILAAPLSILETQWQSVALYCINVLAAWGCYVECRRLWAWLRLSSAPLTFAADRLPRWIFWLAAATVLLPVLNCLQRGQLGVLMLYPLLVGFRWAVCSRWWFGMMAGGITMAFPVTVKLTPALPVALVCLELILAAWAKGAHEMTWRRAAAVSAGVLMGAMLFLFVVPSLIVGPRKNIEYLQTWMHRVAATNDVGMINDFNAHSKRNQSLTNAVYRIGNLIGYEIGSAPSDDALDDLVTRNNATLMDNLTVSGVMLLVRAALLVLMFAVGWRGVRSGDRLTIVMAAALACLATLVISPLSWGHYYVIWLPAAVLCPAWLWLHGRSRLAAGMAIMACTLVWAHYVLLSWTGRIGLLGIGTSVWFTIACVMAIRLTSAKQSAAVNTVVEFKWPRAITSPASSRSFRHADDAVHSS